MPRLCLPVPFPIPSRQRNSSGGRRTVVRRPRHARGTTAGAVFACWLCCYDIGATIAPAVIRYVAVAVVLDVAKATVLAMAVKVSLFDC